jgi:signal transduction histidine kinase
MIGRWPLRIRLTAAFTAVMALVLAAVALATVAHSRAALDESINDSLARRLGELQASAASITPGTPLAGGSADAAAQVLDRAGTVVASTPDDAGQALLGGAELAAASHGSWNADHGNPDGSGPVRIVAGPAGGGRVAVVSASLAARDAAVADLGRELAVAFPPVLLAAAVGGYLLAAGALRPVERMRARAAAITADGSRQRLPVPPARDEIARLGVTLNDLLGRLQDALSRERRFVADASHELRTPLSLLTTELELALRRPRGVEELTAALGSALEETGRLSRLAQDLLLLARSDQPDRPRETAPTRLRPALETVLARYRAPQRVPVLDCPPTLVVQVNTDDLDRAVSNLIDNALQHGEGPVTVTARPGDTDKQPVTIEVRDHGPGFDAAFLPRAFERFARADDARTRGGTGLGLAITAALARRNNGEVSAGNHPEGGAMLTLTLPAGSATATEDAAVR